MKFLTCALMLLSSHAEDIKRLQMSGEEKVFWQRFLQNDGFSIPIDVPPLFPPAPTPIASPFTPLPDLPTAPTSMSQSKGGMSKKSGMSPGKMSSGSMISGSRIPSTSKTSSPQGRPNVGNPKSPVGAGNNATGTTSPQGRPSIGNPSSPVGAGNNTSGTTSPQGRPSIGAPSSPVAAGNNTTGTTSPQGRPNIGNPNSTAGVVNTTVTNSSFVPVCKQDTSGSFLQYNDPEYDSPNTETVLSKVATFERTDKALATFIQVSNDVRDTLPNLAAIDSVISSKIFKNTLNAIGGVAGFVSLGLNLLGPIFGIGGDSTEDAILSAVTEGFRMINEQMTALQEQIRQGFLQVQAFIGDTVLDELSADLDSTLRQFNEYVSADNITRIYYDASLRAYCNEPFHTPRDAFYNLYGNACENCTFAPQKRANIKQISAELNPFSQANFRATFSNFIQLSMMNAMFLHSVCLPPIEGSCVDRSTDAVWQNGITDMTAAFNETVDVLGTAADSLSDWVRLLPVATLQEFFPDGVENLQAANAVLTFLNQTQPDFYLQVLVSDRGGDFFRDNIWRSGCQTSTNMCMTTRFDTGHFWFDIKGKGLSIRYRLKSLPPAPSTITSNGNTIPFPDFFNVVADRLNVPRSTQLQRPDGIECPLDFLVNEVSNTGEEFPTILRLFPACLIDTCLSCDSSEKDAFNAVLLSESYYIFRTGYNNVQEASNNATAFNRFNPVIGETFLLNGEVNEFTFYYN